VAQQLWDIAEPVKTPGWIVFKKEMKIDPGKLFTQYKTTFHLSEGNEMNLVTEEKDELGLEHFNYQQYYKKIKIEGAEFTVHAKDNVALKANGKIAMDFTSDQTAPKINEQQALAIAKKIVPSTKYYNENTLAKDVLIRADSLPDYQPKGVLVFRKNEDTSSYQLAWVFKLYSLDVKNAKQVYINALTGDSIAALPLLPNCATGGGNTTFRGNQQFNTRSTNGNFTLVDDCNGNLLTQRQKAADGTLTDLQDNDNNWNNSSRSDVTSFWALGIAYDYFRLIHKRNSYDGKNGNMTIFNDQTDANAHGGGGVITIGPGATNNDADDFNTTDIVAHEFTHSVVEQTAKLKLDADAESNALNESFSDMFGIAARRWEERTTTNPAASWVIGDERGCGICRDFKTPGNTVNPAYYKGNNWQSVIGSIDPHNNGEVQNHWFYLLVAGESSINEKGENYSITGIGLAKAEKIIYRSLLRYLNSNSTYEDARQGSIDAATDLFGANSNEVIQVIKAWCAVGLCDYTVATSPDKYDRPGGNLNPASPDHNNALQEATILPVSMVLQNEVSTTLKVTDLNIYPFTDADYFKIPALVFTSVNNKLGACSKDVVYIHFNTNVNLRLFSDNQLVATYNDISYVKLPGVNPNNAIIEVTPVFPGQLPTYDFTISHHIEFDQSCIPQLKPKDKFELLQECIMCRDFILNGKEELVINPPYLNVDRYPDTKYLLYWNGGDQLTVNIQLESGNALKVDLLTPEGKLLNSSSNNQPQGGFTRELSLQQRGLAEGFYVVSFTNFGNGTKLRVNLPQNIRLQNIRLPGIR